jgi:tetratricopeptide (TPR) repeat protein
MIPKQSRHVSYEGEYRDPIQVMAVEEYRDTTGITGPVSQKKISAFWKERTIAEIKADPLRWGRLMVKKSWLIFWNHEVPNNRSYTFTAHQETPMLRWLPVRWWLLLILLPWGITALYNREQKESILWILGYMVIFSGTVVLFFVNSRFRIPLWPGMAIVAGGGLQYLWSSFKKRTLPIRPAIASGVLLIVSVINWFGVPPDPVENDLSMRAIAYSEQGRYDKALPDIRQCIEYAPYNPRYHFIHGNVLMGTGNHVDSINAYLTAISLDPSDPAFHCNLGVALENGNQVEGAEQAYRKALQVLPDYKAAQINLVLLLIRQGKTEQAQPLLAPLLERDPQNPILLCSEAVLRFKESNDPAALKHANELHPHLANQLLERHPSGND